MIYTFVKTNLQAVMTDRLQVILQREGITAAKFASALGVQPSALSHLLSGRNKPSYDFITRFIMVYPAYNIEWLLVGKQPMLKEDIAQTESKAPAATTIDEPQTLFIANDESARLAPQEPSQPLPQHSIMAQAAAPQSGSQSTTAPQTTPQPSAPVQPAHQPSSINSATEPVAPQHNNTNARAQADPQPTITAAKTPKKVIILYDDHTFESFEYLK